jgi:hypothetical protein
VIAALALFGFISMCRALWLAPIPWAPAAFAAASLGPQQTPYQQFGSNPNCGAGGFCNIIFPAVTGDTLISQVTCSITLSNSQGVNVAALGNTQGGSMYLQAGGQNEIFNNGINTMYWFINTQTHMFFPSGQQPVASIIYAGGTGSLSCSVFGYTTFGNPTPASAPPSPASEASSTPFFRRVAQ